MTELVQINTVTGQNYYDENGAVTFVGYEHSAQVEIARLNDDLTCHSEALLAWKMNCQHLLDVMDNQGFDERDLGDEDESAIKGIRDDLATLTPETKP